VNYILVWLQEENWRVIYHTGKKVVPLPTSKELEAVFTGLERQLELDPKLKFAEVGPFRVERAKFVYKYDREALWQHQASISGT
jgi:hypothetical protein